jgi:hypothetical protein
VTPHSTKQQKICGEQSMQYKIIGYSCLATRPEKEKWKKLIIQKDFIQDDQNISHGCHVVIFHFLKNYSK